MNQPTLFESKPETGIVKAAPISTVNENMLDNPRIFAQAQASKTVEMAINGIGRLVELDLIDQKASPAHGYFSCRMSWATVLLVRKDKALRVRLSIPLAKGKQLFRSFGKRGRVQGIVTLQLKDGAVDFDATHYIYHAEKINAAPKKGKGGA